MNLQVQLLAVAVSNIELCSVHLCSHYKSLHYDAEGLYVLGHCKLQEVGEYQLYGNVESMDSVELVDSYRDALLLAFSSAKVRSLIE